VLFASAISCTICSEKKGPKKKDKADRVTVTGPYQFPLAKEEDEFQNTCIYNHKKQRPNQRPPPPPLRPIIQYPAITVSVSPTHQHTHQQPHFHATKTCISIHKIQSLHSLNSHYCIMSFLEFQDAIALKNELSITQCLSPAFQFSAESELITVPSPSVEEPGSLLPVLNFFTS
jgi:hypothetical protein